MVTELYVIIFLGHKYSSNHLIPFILVIVYSNLILPDLGLDLGNFHLHDLLHRPLLDVRNLDDPLDVLDLRDLDLALLHDRHRLVDDALLHLNLRNLNNLLHGLDLRDFDDLLDVLNLRDLL